MRVLIIPLAAEKNPVPSGNIINCKNKLTKTQTKLQVAGNAVILFGARPLTNGSSVFIQQGGT